MIESKFQKDLIIELKNRFPGCVVVKNDSGYLQGFPDLTVFHGQRWAVLEVKASEKASHQPNQDYYINKLNTMSFARFIFPENKEVVLNDLERSFERRT